MSCWWPAAVFGGIIETDAQRELWGFRDPKAQTPAPENSVADILRIAFWIRNVVE